MENHLYWKLQSVADEDSDFELFKNKYGRIYDEFGVLKEMRTDEEMEQLFKRIAYKNPLFSKIFSLTTAFVSEGKIRVLYQIGEEKDLIQTFLNLINKPFFASHTIVQLDAGVLLPYFGIRAEKNGLTVSHKQLQYKGLKPWDLKCVSFRDYFKGAGDYNLTLPEIASIYGLKSDYIDFFYENDYMDSGEYNMLMESAKNEISLMINCHRKSLGEDVIEDIEFKHEMVEAVEQEGEFDPFKEIVKTATFTPQIKKAIQERAKGKRLTKADKENLKVIIYNAWLQNDFIAGRMDNKTVKQDKQAEVDKFVDGL